MKIIAAVNVDMEHAPLGTRSYLADVYQGKSFLRRTMERLCRVQSVQSVHVMCPADQAERIKPMLDGLEVQLETHTAPPPPYRQLVNASRMWGLDGWRGGVGSLSVFDEDFHAPLLHALVQRMGAEAVLTIPAAAAVVDPALLDGMIQHYEQNREIIRLTITQTPPGLGGFIIDRFLLADLAAAGLPPGSQLIYKPANPSADLTGRETCYRPSLEIIEAAGRLLCDTHRSTDRVRRLLDDGGETWNAVQIARWMTSTEARHVAEFPSEIEIELTTDDPHSAGSLLRPRGDETGPRGPIGLERIHQMIEAIGAYDDVRIVLGGFGEPCCHPQFGEICRMLHDSKAAAVAVRTNAAMEDPAIESVLFETPVDVVEVTLDAACAESYELIHGVDSFESVLARLNCWIDRRNKEQRVLPLIVPSMIKAHETLDDLEPFVDQWQKSLGTLLVTGYSHCAGQRPRRAVTSVSPPRRSICRRVFSRAMILADGRMTTCDQDFTGKQTVGDLTKQSFTSLWHDDVMQDLRTQTCAPAPLCGSCDEWHRP